MKLRKKHPNVLWEEFGMHLQTGSRDFSSIFLSCSSRTKVNNAAKDLVKDGWELFRFEKLGRWEATLIKKNEN